MVEPFVKTHARTFRPIVTQCGVTRHNGASVPRLTQHAFGLISSRHCYCANGPSRATTTPPRTPIPRHAVAQRADQSGESAMGAVRGGATGSAAVVEALSRSTQGRIN